MSNHASFLPDDYLAQRHERRTNLVSLVLFAAVMLFVFLAFVFTNQRWAQVKQDQTAINAKYQTAAEGIKALTELQDQRKQMLHKADLAAALVERVPRSILLAELINRMPNRLSLLEFEMKSKKIQALQKTGKPAANTGRLAPLTKEEAAKSQDRILPPRYETTITLVGVAPSDFEVSRYITELNVYSLLTDVNLLYSEEQQHDDQTVRQFSIEFKLDSSADVRSIEPARASDDPRNPMSEKLRFQPVGSAPVGRTPPGDPRSKGD